MTENKVGKLQRVDLREVWKHEAHNFTQWLEHNADVLSASIKLPIRNVEREHAAGSFSIDLVAEDDTGGTIIIENQLEKSNHDHLGKLITYLTALEARTAIWIVSDPRPEHIAAIAWLNESTAANFYVVKVEAIRIDNSLPAPLFTVIVGPSIEAREAGLTKKNIAERFALRKRWWSELLTRAAKVSKLHAHISPREYAWSEPVQEFLG
jgi:hypothetical protein